MGTSNSRIEQIYRMLEKSHNMQQEALQLQFNALCSLLEFVSNTDRKATNVINTLAAPGNGETYTVDEIASILRVSVSTVYKWVQGNRIPHTKPNGGKVIFYKHQLTEFFNKYQLQK